METMFQSPQWGSNSKVTVRVKSLEYNGFSPRNGEVILKVDIIWEDEIQNSFSPRNGEVILKSNV